MSNIDNMNHPKEEGMDGNNPNSSNSPNNTNATLNGQGKRGPGRPRRIVDPNQPAPEKRQRGRPKGSRSTGNVKVKSDLHLDAAKMIAYNIFKYLKKHPSLAGSQEKLAQASGLSSAVISRCMKGSDVEISTETLDSLSRALGVRAFDLMKAPSSELRRYWSRASNISDVKMGTRRIPLISYVQAGSWTEAVDSYPPGQAVEWLLTDLDSSSSTFALEIRGDSMLPDFMSGDRVIIDPSISPQPGDYVVAKSIEEGATFKKYRPRGIGADGREIIELTPLNPDYPVLRSDVIPIHIVGVMIEHRRYRRR